MADRADHRAGDSGGTPRVAIVVSRYTASVTGALLEGAVGEYRRRGGDPSMLAVYEAPGSFEVPAIAMAAAKSGSFGAVVALSCIIRGETRHDRYLAQAVASGLMSVSIQTGVPVGFGVLTVESPRQARERAGGKKGNKGSEAMAAALDAAASAARAAQGKPAPPALAPREDKAASAVRRDA